MKKRLTAVMLSLCMMLMLFPTTAFAVEKYDLYLGYTQITSENAGDVLGDGTISYDPDTCTLMLDNAKLPTGILTYGNDSKVLTINVIGNCEINKASGNGISLQGKSTAGPVYHRDRLRITGDGTLKISAMVGISAYDDVTVEDTNIEINTSNLAISVQNINGDQRKGNLNIINSTVTATTNGSSTNVFWIESGGIKIDNSTVIASAESSSNPALWAADFIEITDKSHVEATGGSSNTFYSDGDIVINDSTVEATDTSEDAFPTIYAYGDIIVENGSNVTAESKGMRGVFTDGNMTINDSTVTSSGTTDEGMVVVGTLNVNNSKLTASSKPNDIIPAIVTEHLSITASDVTAHGGIQLYGYYNSYTENISFSITPAGGKLAEFKVDGNNWDGSAAVHFKEGEESPYNTTINFGTDEMNWLGAYRYIHIGEHIHAGGTATCQDKAVCEDCGREYGDVDPDNHSFTNYVYNNDATCTANGTETAKCDRCDATHTREKSGTALGHQAVKTEVKAATCTKDGNIEYWYCETCGKYFSDEEFTQEISKEDTSVKAKGHGEPELKNEKGATCTVEGYTGDKVCKDCGEILEKGEVVPMLAHSYKDGTCTVCGIADPNYKPVSDSPETGDSSNVALWGGLMALALCGIFSLVFIQKKGKHARGREWL